MNARSNAEHLLLQHGPYACMPVVSACNAVNGMFVESHADDVDSDGASSRTLAAHDRWSTYADPRRTRMHTAATFMRLISRHVA